MARRRILVVCPFPEGVAAAQRLKYEQYLDDWRAAGYSVTVAPFMDRTLWDVVYGKGKHAAKVAGTVRGFARRWALLPKVRSYDLVYMLMYVAPIGTSLLERLYRKAARRLVYDIEDNAMEQKGNNLNPLAQLVRGKDKFAYCIREADHVIASSPALAERCAAQNKHGRATYITSSMDTDRFVPAGRYTNSARKVTIGWTGTFSTRPYLDLLRPVFLELKKHRDFRLLVIGNFDYEAPEMDLEVIRWTAEHEVADLQKMDIGVYPLPMDPWVMGKSGLKAIQYMTMGLPAVATDISTAQTFIRHGENGFLVKTEADWVDVLIRLIDSADLRRRVGTAARKTVMERFSKHAVGGQYLQILNSQFSS